jgi:hypothetical protein
VLLQDFSAFRVVADIGGGYGRLLEDIMDTYPGASVWRSPVWLTAHPSCKHPDIGRDSALRQLAIPLLHTRSHQLQSAVAQTARHSIWHATAHSILAECRCQNWRAAALVVACQHSITNNCPVQVCRRASCLSWPQWWT